MKNYKDYKVLRVAVLPEFLEGETLYVTETNTKYKCTAYSCISGTKVSVTSCFLSSAIEACYDEIRY